MQRELQVPHNVNMIAAGQGEDKASFYPTQNVLSL